MKSIISSLGLEKDQVMTEGEPIELIYILSKKYLIDFTYNIVTISPSRL